VKFTLSPFELFVLPTRTRFPFRYGIASMTDVPQLFVRTRVRVGADDGRYGLAAEGLPPKWFTKEPSTTFEEDLPQMLAVVQHATVAAREIARTPLTFFELWRELDRQQTAWASARGIAPLLAHLGVSLVERAVLDAVCRVAGEPLHQAIRRNRLDLRLGDIYQDLSGMVPGDVLPSAPLPACAVRHTVGLGDPITAADILPGDRADDGLPQDLESCIRAYGLHYFKVKLTGKLDVDAPRLELLVSLFEREAPGAWQVTLDGNENFHDFGAFRGFWEDARSRGALDPLWSRVLVVEQPVHRSHALSPGASTALREWDDRPPLIVDESDGAVGDVPLALQLGYAGASHKNCKGIVKGLANAALLHRVRSAGGAAVLTGEDLANLGPVALLQDLAMMAALGITHVERNGHHYYRGLSMFPQAWQDAALAAHGDLYWRHPQGFPTLRIERGRVELGTINEAPFGVGPVFDPSAFDRLGQGVV
jgi:hypothetical protein